MPTKSDAELAILFAKYTQDRCKRIVDKPCDTSTRETCQAMLQQNYLPSMGKKRQKITAIRTSALERGNPWALWSGRGDKFLADHRSGATALERRSTGSTVKKPIVLPPPFQASPNLSSLALSSQNVPAAPDQRGPQNRQGRGGVKGCRGGGASQSQGGPRPTPRSSTKSQPNLNRTRELVVSACVFVLDLCVVAHGDSWRIVR